MYLKFSQAQRLYKEISKALNAEIFPSVNKSSSSNPNTLRSSKQKDKKIQSDKPPEDVSLEALFES